MGAWENSVRWGIFRAGGGWSAAAWTPKGLSALVLPRPNQETALRKLQECLPPFRRDYFEKSPAKVPANLQQQTRHALQGRSFRVNRFDISFLTLFQQKILNATRKIPWGQTRTYAWVARKAGSPRGFRAAGQALTRNPVSIFIPCHRVIAGGSRIGGYGGGLKWKLKLLNNEGVKVTEGMVEHS